MLTRLDRDVALLVVDLQRGLSQRSLTQPFGEIVRRANVLAAEFRRHGLPVVLITAGGVPPGRVDVPARSAGVALDENFAELAPGLVRADDDLIVSKRSPGAFARTGLDEMLAGRGVTQVVVAGVTTSGGVAATGRQAWELGYHVAFPTDVTGDRDVEVHADAVASVLPRIGQVASTAEICAALADPRPGAGLGAGRTA